MAVDSERLNELLGKAIVDFGATFHAALVRVGDKNIALRLKYLTRSSLAPPTLSDYKEVRPFTKHSTKRFAQQAPFNQQVHTD